MMMFPNRMTMKKNVWGWAWFLGMLLGMVNPLLAEELNARFLDGTQSRGMLQGETPEELRFISQGADRDLSGIRRIEFPRSSPVLKSSAPLRVFHLRGGEQITAELNEFGEDQITLIWQGKEITLPKQSVLAIEQLPTERQVLFENFDAPRLAPVWQASGDATLRDLEDQMALEFSGDASLSHSLDRPIGEGRMSAAFFDPQPKSRNSTLGLELNFGKENTRRKLIIHLALAEEFHRVIPSPNLRLTMQPVRRTAGWHQVAVVFDEVRFQVLIDSQLLAYGRPFDGPLKSFRLFSMRAENTTGLPREFWLDCVQLSEFLTDPLPIKRISLQKQSQVLTASGEDFYGDFVAVDSTEVRIRGPFGEVALPWTQVRRVVFAEDNARQEPPSKEILTLTGWQAELTFQRFADHPSHFADRLTGTILAADAHSLTLAHPQLGTHKISWDKLDFIEPKFFGQSWILSPEQKHLGNETRTDFLHPNAEGSQWQGEFELESAPSAAAFLRIRAAELEPAGQGTPPGSLHLAELRNGGLGTEIVLNGTSLGRLNDQMIRKANRDSPDEIRLAIPPSLLKPGRNTWLIRQSPMRSEPEEFDDCELGPIVLEVAKSQRP